jgi:hypothetical protein
MHDGILAVFFVFEVFHADGKGQVAVTLKQDFDDLALRRLPVCVQELAVGNGPGPFSNGEIACREVTF